MNSDKKTILKMMLISLAPIIAFIFVDEYYGPTAGLIAGIVLGILETTMLYIVEKKLDKFGVGSTILIIIMGGISLASGNEIYFKLKPAIVNLVMLLVLLGSLIVKKPIMLLFAKKQFGENFNPSPMIIAYFAGVTFRISLLVLIHTVLIVYSAFFMSNAAWGFITKGGSFLMMGIYLAIELFYSRFILPRRYARKRESEKEAEMEKLILKRKNIKK